MEINVKLNPPIMPNFLTLQMPPARREEGFKHAPVIAVSELTRAQAEEYAELMRQEFLAHWERKVKSANPLHDNPNK